MLLFNFISIIMSFRQYDEDDILFLQTGGEPVPVLSHCPGLYCGRIELEDGALTECGACPRGYRRNENSTCMSCDAAPTFYDWLYLGFMAMIIPGLHCFFIDFTNTKKSKKLIILHISAVIESIISAFATLLAVEPYGSLQLRSCSASRLSDWYTMLHNPCPDYIHTLHCTQEAVYPLYTIVMIYYSFCLVSMMIVRPVLSTYAVHHNGTKSIYAALYFLPILTVIHAVLAGLIYYSFPYILMVVSLVTNAIHFAWFPDQDIKSLVLANVKDVRNLAIVLSHWLLHAYSIISITLFTEPAFHGALLCLVPFPALYYLLTVKFTDPDALESV